ncbi:hypothetical protein BJ970_006318 [Saccharopolyspora phatthalungensis]|uniref:Uncharacterized protein n=1 Tax=Saccharopolyspora phatthalungensis TaxID=664693 RepID=A0A840QIV8_9PSEU|nr:hypothetical protein [Saccharopolyspora phatthalungensis]
MNSGTKEVYPRWLPGPSLRDTETHLVAQQRNSYGACGGLVMWAEPGHPTTMRPRCPDCLAKAKENIPNPGRR